MKDEDWFDIAIVGAGVSCAFTLIHYVSLLELTPPEKPVRAIVVEKSDELWTGVPYGSRTGHSALAVAPLEEFILPEEERARFADWLSGNCSWLFKPPAQRDAQLSANWHRTNGKAIAEGGWDGIFVPRHAFGTYMQQRVGAVVQRAAKLGLLTLRIVAADVIDIQPTDDGHRLELAPTSRQRAPLRTRTVVLAIGSPPNQLFRHSNADDARGDRCYIECMYEPSMDYNVNRICEAIRRSHGESRGRVLIIGSKAGALDALYCLTNSDEANRLITHFTILSPSAALPYRLSRREPSASFSPKNLLSLASSRSCTARRILNAVRRDLAHATTQDVSVADIHAEISRAMMNAVNRLSLDEARAFVSKYGNEIGRIQRRAGAEYCDVVEGLIAQGRLELLKGRFARFLRSQEAGPECECVVRTNEGKQVLIARTGIVINCAGFRNVTQSSTRLMRNLILRGLCVPNASKRGFTVNEEFETSRNCYLMGPLLAGNINSTMRIWQAESCSRIIEMSRQLAQVLAAKTPQATHRQ